jgi:hypothetical protein
VTDEPEGDEEFWGSVGTDRSSKTLLVNILKECDANVVETIGGDPLEIDLVKRCPSLRFAGGPDGSTRVYCEDCGFVCSVVVHKDDQTLISPGAEPDELDEFLAVAGSERYDFNDDDGDPFG